MPPRQPPKVYQLLLRSHKMTIFLTRMPTSTVQEIKEEALSAFLSDVNLNDVPKVAGVNDFEICKLLRGRDAVGPIPQYEILDHSKAIKDCGILNWEILYFQFRDEATGDLQPVMFTQPPTFEEEDMPPPPSASLNKGKRKATD
ncbi:hypothetical protein IW261DRAFT_1438192 [Armillaria novae-zelandiae]|uniref:Uncharacterized protein n=1 Tax=Armillaria novae-zelandiae TaxID=153914 RepID=A0AA39PVV0_9AGAR|nr:hypothetical protein IW261DRAFT_1438192 [Armillaria novae-zelandiae]